MLNQCLCILKIKWDSNINPEYSTDVLTQKYFVSSKKIKSGEKSIKKFCKILEGICALFFFFLLFNIHYIFSLFL